MLSQDCLTVRNAVDRMAESRPRDVVLTGAETGYEVAYADFRRQCNELVQRFFSLGLSKGDKVAFMLDNGLFTSGLLLGAMYGGFVPVPLNVRAGRLHLAYVLDHCDAAVVFVSADYLPMVSEIQGELGQTLLVIQADEESGPDWTIARHSVRPLPDVHGDDDALLMYTSGSTGQPKGAILSQRNIVAAGWNSVAAHDLSAQDRSLCVLPLYHINAITVTLMSSILVGGTVIMPHKFLVRSFWTWITEYRCTWSALVPGIISQLLDWIDPCAEGMAEGLRQIRFMRSSSAPLAPSLHRAFDERFPILLIEAMGSTEAAGNVFSNPLPPGKNKIGSPGKPFGFEAKVVDRAGNDVPQGQPGEIVLRGPSIMKCYYKNPAETSSALAHDGWLRTGDLACVDEDGYFFIVGRAKELILKGGMNIAPRQIDEALEAHPAVLEAAVVGILDHYLGEDIIAFAVLRPNASVDVGELLDFCESQLGSFKTPSRIHLVEELPKGPSGKVQRLRLVEQFKELCQSSRTYARANGQSAVQSVPEFKAPRTPVEELIAEVWSVALKVNNVGVNDNFFGLGGHSLLAIETLFRIRKRLAVDLSLNDFFTHATVARQAQLVNERLFGSHDAGKPTSTENEGAIIDPPHVRRAVLEEIIHQRCNDISRDVTIPPRDRTSVCPLSHAQERLWFLEQLYPGMLAYNEPEAILLKGELDPHLLEDALNVIVARHEALRTRIRVDEGRPVQFVCDDWRLKLATVDLTAMVVNDREAAVQHRLDEETRRSFDLSAAPPIRAMLLRLGPEEHVFVLTLHHVICDGWSMGIFYRELGEVYRALYQGRPHNLSPLRIQYGDYAVWQRRQVDEGNLVEEHLAFWTEYLAGAPAALEMPTKGPRPAIFSHEGEKQSHPLGAAPLRGLRVLSQREEVSLFMILTAAFNVLLHRYTSQEDIVLGVPIANRDRPELLELFGFLIDFHALRTDLSGNPTFREVISRVQRGMLEVNAHRAIPIEKVVAALRPQRDLSRGPLFQAMLIWKDQHVQMQSIDLEGLSVSHVPAHPKSAKWDLTLWLTDVGDDLWIEVEYCTSIFSAEMIRRMVEQFQHLLSEVVADPLRRIDELPLLPDAQREQMLVEWNRTASEYPRETCLHELFEAQVERTPEAPAVVCGKQELTYRQLNARANQLAHHLRELGVGPEVLVGVCLDRSLDMVVGLLGILKAGGAYVPLDPAYPKDRVAFMLQDSQASVLLTQRTLVEDLPAHSAKVICLDRDWPRIGVQPDGNLTPVAGATNLAYVIYTSGSTGKPKGVQIPHRAVVNFLSSMQSKLGLTTDDALLAVTTLSFDIAGLELFLPLTTGARVVIASSDVTADGRRLSSLMNNCGATVMQATPVTWRLLLEAGWAGSPGLRILCGGEAWSSELAKELLRRCASLWNAYGPTETTIWSSLSKVEAGKPVLIGPPIANTTFYVLDAGGQPTPIGVPGELLIGGDGLARGYRNRPELTKERFVADPFSQEPGARLYKTGDLVRYLTDGSIEFLGRTDHQVKIRGFRIELGEIKSVIETHPAVRESVVVVREDALGDKRLVAYVIPKNSETVSVDELRNTLKQALPAYMIPTAFVFLTAFPLTPNGKLDRKSLPPPRDSEGGTDASYVAPRTLKEEILCGLFAELLGIARVGIEDNFFELGGHSLMAVQLIKRINQTLKIEVGLLTLFQNPTVEQLARLVVGIRLTSKRLPAVVTIKNDGAKPPVYLILGGRNEFLLAQLLDGGRPIFGIEVSWPNAWRNAMSHGTISSMPTMERMAAPFVEALQSHVRSSTCVLVGYSFLGSLVFEAAHQFQKQGGEVEMVFLLDSWARYPTAREIVRHNLQQLTKQSPNGRLIDVLPQLIRSGVGGSWRLAQRVLMARIRNVLSKFRPTSPLPREIMEVVELIAKFEEQGLAVPWDVVVPALEVLRDSYHFRPLDGRGVLFRTEYDQNPDIASDDRQGWRDLFTTLEAIPVPGDHRSMLRQPNNQMLAKKINEVLERDSKRTLNTEVSRDLAMSHE